MDRLKKALKMFVFGIIIMLAAAGLGISGAIFPSHKDKQLLPETKIEQVEEKEEDEDDEIKGIKG